MGFDNDNLWKVPLKTVTEEDALYCRKLLETLVESYKTIFDKPHNEILDIIKQMKKYIPSEESKVNTEKMKLEIQQKTIKIKSKI